MHAPMAHLQEAQHSECWQEADPGADIQMAITFDWELRFMQGWTFWKSYEALYLTTKFFNWVRTNS